MSARTLTQLAVLALGLAALVLGAIVVAREAGTASAGGPDAGPCDLTTAPSPLSPAHEDVVLLVWPDPGVTVTLDGKPVVSLPEDPQSFPPGAHLLGAECKGATHTLTVELRPFTPAAVHAGCEAFFVVGADCEGCAPTDAARKAAAKAGRESGQFAAAAEQEKLEHQVRARAAHVLLGRWNALTERYSRVVQVVGRAAPGPVASANQRFEELSAGFAQATHANDPVAQDRSIRAAEETLRVFLHQSRLARPEDCDFQRRLTAAL